MMSSFENPEAPLETTCLPTVVPLDFHGQTPVSQALLGTTDAWE